MKSKLFLIVGCVAVLVAAPLWSSSGHAPAGADPVVDEAPLGRSCVVTLDSRDGPKPVHPGEANALSGFIAPDTARGVLLRLDAGWVVLRDGTDENWIPREKVLMIRAFR
jgi:hypothetical protein